MRLSVAKRHRPGHNRVHAVAFALIGMVILRCPDIIPGQHHTALGQPSPRQNPPETKTPLRGKTPLPDKTPSGQPPWITPPPPLGQTPQDKTPLVKTSCWDRPETQIFGNIKRTRPRS
jgi:hypothetical protein